MPYNDLLGWANQKTSLPIKVDDIKVWFLNNRLQERICFIKAQIDSTILRGYITQYTTRNAVYCNDTERCSDIYYSSELNICWERFVCCKEMLHIFDLKNEMASNKGDVKKLLTDITSPLPPDHKNISLQLITEHICEFITIEVLFPKSLRDKISPYYENGKLSAYEIALLARIPEYYVPVALDGRLDKVITAIAK